MNDDSPVQQNGTARKGGTEARPTVVVLKGKAQSRQRQAVPPTVSKHKKRKPGAIYVENEMIQEMLDTLQELHAAQGKIVRQIQSQRDALITERRTLQETLQILRSDYMQQGKLKAQLQSQRDELVMERRILLETLQTMLEQHSHQVKALAQSEAQRDSLEIERRTLQEALHSLREDPSRQRKVSGYLLPAGLDVIPLPVGRNSITSEEKALFDEKLAFAIKAGGVEALEALVGKQVAGCSLLLAASCYLSGAKMALANGHIDVASRLAESALRNDWGTATVRDAAHIYHDAALLEKANQLVDRLESMQESVGAGDRRFIDEVRGQVQLVSWVKEPASSRRLPVMKGRVLNVLAFSLPYSSVGYATRSHGLAIGIKKSGWDIRPYTRPCFPYDFKPGLEAQILPEHDDVDGLAYRRIFDFDRKGMNEARYLHASITSLTRVIEREQPEVVHAASNYATALPALIASRRLGVPFVYEMRGFWEVTRSSRDEAFENTPKYRFMQLFDGLVAKHADHVITINTAMKEELIARGLQAEKISIVFNSVDPARFIPNPPKVALAEKLGIPVGVPVIGYVGSILDYEGLDDLMTAAAGLKQSGREFRVLLVGDGAELESIRAQVQSLSLDDKVILTGRVPHEEVEDYYSLVDIAPFPRKPWKVCELVSPLKPFEAMALEKVVVVSSTRALKEIVDHERTGYVFEKGNVDSLRLILDCLICHPEKRASVGKAAREWIIKERSWDRAGATVSKAYERVRV